MFMLAKNMHFFIPYCLGENSTFANETSHTVRDTHWFTEDESVSNRLFMNRGAHVKNLWGGGGCWTLGTDF